MKIGDKQAYENCIIKQNDVLSVLSLEIKEIVFDYFNIITKEYEIAFEKWKVDDDYKNQITEIKKQIDEEYLEKKYEVPPTLTKEKAQELVDTK